VKWGKGVTKPPPSLLFDTITFMEWEGEGAWHANPFPFFIFKLFKCKVEEWGTPLIFNFDILKYSTL
jgi:hypothetical protein